MYFLRFANIITENDVRREGMKALVRERYGTPEVLEWKESDTPEVPADGVLVQVRTFSLNPTDKYFMLGQPRLLSRPRPRLPKPER